MTYKQPNSLIKELSPYLLQHAYNPVNWYSWNDEAFEKARIENKPIFLSIGYSTCHWCHVMEKESFEDQEIAALMNDTFISIKVDREERPDIDNIYMSVCQIMTGSGGWPLSIIMTPDQKPFFAGTYFPKESKYNRVGFKDLILSIKSAWYNKQKEIYESAEEITKHLINYHHKENQKIALDKSVLDAAYERFKNRYDTINGGFGSAPKFPSPHNLMFLLRYWHSTGELKALNMVIKTLTSMRKGGIYDHIGFGFHRYSTDSNWLVPHFEKMLYDQAMLTIAYTEAYQATHNELFKQTVDEILLYLLRDMRSEKGGFFSAEDADTDGEEGQTYVWTYQEITDILEESDANFITKVFNIKPEGNYHEESKKELTGKNILHLQKTFNELAEEYDQPERVFTDKFNSICDFLFYKRKQRKQPFKDDKILTDWNGLVIAALSIAGRTFDNKKYTNAAKIAYSFIEEYLTINENKLLHRYRNGISEINGNLDDYAFLIWGLIELYESTAEPKYIKDAIKFTNSTINYFYDNEKGGFYFTSDLSDKLLIRTKEIYDGAIPSGNSVMLLNLIKLSRISADSKYQEIAENMIETFSEDFSSAPHGSTFSLIALNYLYSSSYEIVVVNRNFNANSVTFLNSKFLPNKVIVFVNQSEAIPFEYLHTYKLIDQKPTYYVCKNYNCSLPTNEPYEVLQLLK